MEMFSREPFREILCSDPMTLEDPKVEKGQPRSFPTFELGQK